MNRSLLRILFYFEFTLHISLLALMTYGYMLDSTFANITAQEALFIPMMVIVLAFNVLHIWATIHIWNSFEHRNVWAFIATNLIFVTSYLGIAIYLLWTKKSVHRSSLCDEGTSG